jgi:hypothetical protein
VTTITKPITIIRRDTTITTRSQNNRREDGEMTRKQKKFAISTHEKNSVVQRSN